MSYEEASKQLDEIIAKLDSGNLAMSEATALFEQGEKLAKLCYEQLSTAKGKLAIVKEELGKLTVVGEEN